MAMKNTSVPCWYRGGEKKASLGIHGVSYCGDKLTMAQDGGKVHGDNPPHAREICGVGESTREKSVG